MFEEIFDKYSKLYALDADLVRAVAFTESGYNPFAVRFEPTWPDAWLIFPRDHADKLGITYQTEVTLQKCSWGLMQVMGAVARELGFDIEMPKLCDPFIGVEIGCKKLQQLFRRYAYEPDVISAYNQGSPRKTPGGMYLNQTYVDKVSSHLRELRKIKL